jgi:hypothetical protein
MSSSRKSFIRGIQDTEFRIQKKTILTRRRGGLQNMPIMDHAEKSRKNPESIITKAPRTPREPCFFSASQRLCVKFTRQELQPIPLCRRLLNPEF